mgnify:FL=1
MTPIIQRELHKYGIHGHYYPFAERKEEGTAAYVEQDKVYLQNQSLSTWNRKNWH